MLAIPGVVLGSPPMAPAGGRPAGVHGVGVAVAAPQRRPPDLAAHVPSSRPGRVRGRGQQDGAEVAAALPAADGTVVARAQAPSGKPDGRHAARRARRCTATRARRRSEPVQPGEALGEGGQAGPRIRESNRRNRRSGVHAPQATPGSARAERIRRPARCTGREADRKTLRSPWLASCSFVPVRTAKVNRNFTRGPGPNAFSGALAPHSPPSSRASRRRSRARCAR